MSLKPENIETIKQWGIKSISERVINELSDAAHELKLTNGQMIEKVWDHYKSGGVATGQSVNMVADLTALLNAGGPWTEHNPLPAEARSFINAFARNARKPGSQPGITARSGFQPQQLM